MKTHPILLAGVVLGSFAVTGVALVSVTHEAVDARIAGNQRQAMERKLATILPAGQSDNDPLRDTLEVQAKDLLGAAKTQIYRVRNADAPVAVVLEPVVPDGYAGPIRLLVSVLRDGSLGGVRVLSHHETPGLGDKIEEAKSDWILSFKGKSLTDPPRERWAVKRDGGAFDQFTGATITPRSIVGAVKNTLLYVERQGDALFAPSAATAPTSPSPEES
ncbi:electron transport complex subunit RsxG [Thiocystis violascens]|uniref:Ion-translocating oxidoreductase complex subunit G n=1 Tax=Thiocystis violascens (strain ATCC 17096 / DSM 198 / 6111) TaxID=765911 RepID=I3YA77_THIV6|nr:electron transport complex subunit RsxG [Thiocystis violascens]AFL73895.1 electron transport complex, RnfABCDGE type, G subunit [Thiocystis violascens DSM 198]